MSAFAVFTLTDTLDVALLAAEAGELREQVKAVMEACQEPILTYAKTNAPWADITGDARAGLGVEVGSDTGNVWLQLFHTVDYGLWLEVIQSGKWAIIMPTLEGFGKDLIESSLATVNL